MIAKLSFFLSVTLIIYTYLGYPILVFLISLFRNRRVHKGDDEPDVTILIAAYNEATSIEETLRNKIELEYPKDKLEIIVISDGSTDGTDEIVKQYEEQGVRLLRQEPRQGKTAALNIAVPGAKGEILVFSDANSIYEPDAVKKLVANFADPAVGYVTGKMIYTNPDGTTIGDGCTLYMKYENFLRTYETRMNSVVGVDGGIDAVRRELYQPMNPDQLPDFVLPLKVIDQGFRVVYEPEAVLKEPSLKGAKDEYKMRVRVSLRAMWALYDMRHLLAFSRPSTSSTNPPSHLPTFSSSILYSSQLWSHKVLRYLCFIFLFVAYVSNAVLFSEGGPYSLLFVLQNLAYAGAILSPVLDRKGYRLRLLYLFHYFTLLNLASAHAFIKFLFRRKQVMWSPRKG